MPAPEPAAVLRQVASSADVDAFRDLTRDYYAWLGVDLSFQDIDKELLDPLQAFGPPGGCILLAAVPDDGDGNGGAGATATAVGCVAVRPLKVGSGGSQTTTAPESRSVGPDGHGAEPAAATPGCPHTAAGIPTNSTCEMKRLYVRPSHQGRGIGQLLVSAAEREARKLGYSRMVLDTLDRLTSANAVYAKKGFQTTQPYYHNPLEGVVYWHKALSHE